MTVCERIMQLRGFSPEIVDTIIDELQTGVAAIMENIEEGRLEEAIDCCGDVV